VAAGLARGLEEARSVTCRRGRDLDGSSVLAEDSADYGGHIPIILEPSIILGFVLDFHGFQDGGGHIHTTGIGLRMLVIHGLT
jgi:hypothetical protein